MRDILAVAYPQLAEEWHPTCNGALTPRDVTVGSKQKVWWQCQNDRAHAWQAAVYSRAKGHGCPFCSGRLPTSTNSLGACHPELSAQWHPIRNEGLTPHDVKPHSDRTVWWQCQQDSTHVWGAAVKDRVRGNGCPYCRGRIPTPAMALAALYPHLSAEWHPSRNGELTSWVVLPGGHQRIWWRCQRDPSHEWEAVIYNRVKGQGCPFCAGKRATPTTSLQALHPFLAEEWHSEKNGSTTPDAVRPGSHRKVWWQCRREASHIWRAVVKDRVQGKGCPICAGRAVTSATSLGTLYPSLAEEWHPTKNGDLRPSEVVAGSNTRVWWHCAVDRSHEWEAVIANRVNGTGCPMCAHLVVTPATSLAFLHPQLASEWHPTRNEASTPGQVVPGTRRKVWWRCAVDPSHEWEASIVSRVNGCGCPCCSGRAVTPETALGTLAPRLALEWHPTKNGDATPMSVRLHSGKKVWWRCAVDPSHEWEAVVASRAAGRECPYCRKLNGSSVEDLVALLLDEQQVSYERQKVIGYFHVDFYLPATNSVIEVQGCYWHGCLRCGYDDAFHRSRRKQDAVRHAYLQRRGYQLEEIWEHELQHGAAAVRRLVATKFRK